MPYEIQSWTRNSDGKGQVIRGEEQVRLIRVRHFGHARRALGVLVGDFGVCRVTLSRPGTESCWDLYRGNGRDSELDTSMRAVNEESGKTEGVTLDIGPGITSAQVAEAMAQLVTVPKQS